MSGTTDKLVTGSIFGRYEIQERIGEGGMALVFRASLKGPQGFVKEFALKILKEEVAADQEVVRQFITEAKLGAMLSHPNIVSVVDFGEQDGSYFLAMEYIDGMPLSKLFETLKKKKKSLSRNAVLYIMAGLLKALNYAHEFVIPGKGKQPVIHRDVSPENIMIDRAGQLKLVDFGIAKAAFASDKTKTGIVKGKLGYLAPEILKKGRPTPLVDIYAAGVVLYELLANERLGGQRLNEDKIDELDVDDDLKSLIIKATAVDPAQRFQSAAEMLQEVIALGVNEIEGAKELSKLMGRRRSRTKGKATKKTDITGTKSKKPDTVSEDIQKTRKIKEKTLQKSQESGIIEVEEADLKTVEDKKKEGMDSSSTLLIVISAVLALIFGTALILTLLGVHFTKGG